MTPGAQCAGGGDTGVGGCMWFSNYTFISGDPTLPDFMRTFQDIDIGGYPFDYTKVSCYYVPEHPSNSALALS